MFLDQLSDDKLQKKPRRERKWSASLPVTAGAGGGEGEPRAWHRQQPDQRDQPPRQPAEQARHQPPVSVWTAWRLEQVYFQVSRVEWQLIKILVTTDSRLGNNLEEILRFEAEIPPEYKRPSRDLQFDYVNTATARMEATKAVREAEDEANKLLETLVRLVSPDDIDQLYIRWCDICKPWVNLKIPETSSPLSLSCHNRHELKWGPSLLSSSFNIFSPYSPFPWFPHFHTLCTNCPPHTGPHCSPLITHHRYHNSLFYFLIVWMKIWMFGWSHNRLLLK